MTTLRRLSTAGLAVCLAPLPFARAQETSSGNAPQADTNNSSFGRTLQRDLVQERVDLGSCKDGLKGIPGCTETILTGTPFHVTVGSLAPQNGTAGGFAFAEVYHPTFCSAWIDLTHAPAPGTRNACHWSLNFNADAVASGNGSWRAGVYITAARISAHVPVVHFPGQPRARHAARTFTVPSPTVSFYSETDSLNRLFFYGLGPNTTPSGQTAFGLTENVTGVNTVIPIATSWAAPFGLTLLGEINGRFPFLRGRTGETSPSIGSTYTDATAPGLSSQPAYFQAGEGLRLIPAIPAAARLKLNYLVNFQQFVAASDARYSFRRLTADLDHTITLYSRDVGRPASAPPPPAPGVAARNIPPISPTRDVTGSLNARFLAVDSIATAGHVVPFYLDPPVGGSDLNGQSILPSYPDYRFRAPNLLLVHSAYDQSLGKIPVGVFIGVDEAKIGVNRGDISFNHLRHSYSAGITLHAGGLPVVYLLFAWGGNEGHHTIVNISDALLGSGKRPSLF